MARPDRVRSPTYNLCLVHAGPCPLVHVDLFRLAGDEAPAAGSVSDAAFEALGLPELSEGAEAAASVLVVEWADLWAEPPAAHLRVRLALEPSDPARRTLAAEAVGSRARDLLAAWIAEIDPLVP